MQPRKSCAWARKSPETFFRRGMCAAAARHKTCKHAERMPSKDYSIYQRPCRNHMSDSVFLVIRLHEQAYKPSVVCRPYPPACASRHIHARTILLLDIPVDELVIVLSNCSRCVAAALALLHTPEQLLEVLLFQRVLDAAFRTVQPGHCVQATPVRFLVSASFVAEVRAHQVGSRRRSYGLAVSRVPIRGDRSESRNVVFRCVPSHLRPIGTADVHVRVPRDVCARLRLEVAPSDLSGTRCMRLK